jgi:hypothetical protein
LRAGADRGSYGSNGTKLAQNRAQTFPPRHRLLSVVKAAPEAGSSGCSRGLNPAVPQLFVIDAAGTSKAIRRAMASYYGTKTRSFRLDRDRL